MNDRIVTMVAETLTAQNEAIEINAPSRNFTYVHVEAQSPQIQVLYGAQEHVASGYVIERTMYVKVVYCSEGYTYDSHGTSLLS